MVAIIVFFDNERPSRKALENGTRANKSLDEFRGNRDDVTRISETVFAIIESSSCSLAHKTLEYMRNLRRCHTANRDVGMYMESWTRKAVVNCSRSINRVQECNPHFQCHTVHVDRIQGMYKRCPTWGFFFLLLFFLYMQAYSPIRYTLNAEHFLNAINIRQSPSPNCWVAFRVGGNVEQKGIPRSFSSCCNKIQEKFKGKSKREGTQLFHAYNKITRNWSRREIGNQTDSSHRGFSLNEIRSSKFTHYCTYLKKHEILHFVWQ